MYQMFHVFYFQISGNKIMNSSDDDELPDIPGTRFPWMTETKGGLDEAGPSTSGRRYSQQSHSFVTS